MQNLLRMFENVGKIPCNVRNLFVSKEMGELPGKSSRFIGINHNSLLNIPSSLFLIPYSLFLVHYSSFLAQYSLFIIPHSLFLIPCSLFLVHHSSLLVSLRCLHPRPILPLPDPNDLRFRHFKDFHQLLIIFSLVDQFLQEHHFCSGELHHSLIYS